MAACTLDYNLNMEGYRSKNPLEESMGAIVIRMRERYRLQILQTSAKWSKTFSPDFVEVFNFPPHVLASPEFRKLNILDMLESFYLDPSLCECLGPAIESFAIDASQAFGVNEFVVVADVKITKTQVVDQDKLFIWFWAIRLEKERFCGSKSWCSSNVIIQQGNQVSGFFYFRVHLIL